MNSENQHPDSSLALGAEMIRDGRSKLTQGDLGAAHDLFQKILLKIPADCDESFLLRIDACCGLIVRSSINKKPNSVLRDFQKLKSELELQENISPSVRKKIAKRINAVTETLGAMRSWIAVKKLSRLIFKIVTNETPDSLSHRIRALNNLGSALIAEQRFDDAAHIWDCAIQDHGSKGKECCPAPLATIYNNLAELLRLEGQFPLSQQHHFEALQLRQNCFEESHVLVRQSRFNLAQIQAESYDYIEADQQIQAFLDSFPADGAPPTTEYLRAQTLKARLMMELGKYVTAEKLVNQLARSLSETSLRGGKLQVEVHLTRLEVAMKLNKPNIVQSEAARLPQILEQAELLNTVYEGRLYLLLGIVASEQENKDSLVKSEEYFQKAAKLFQNRLPRNHPLLARTVFQLAEIFSRTSRFKRGSQTANGALSILEQTFGNQSVPLFTGLLSMASIILMQKQYNTARHLLKLAGSIYQKNPSTSPVFVLEFQKLLSQTYSGINKPKVAAYYARRAWKTASTLLEIPAAQKVELVERAFLLSSEASRSQEAIVLLQRKIELLSEEFHFAHPSVTEATEQLGKLYVTIDEPENAADQLSKILTVRCSELGEDSALAAELMELTAQMHRKAGQDDKAEQIEKQIQLLSDKSSHVLSDLF